MTDNLCLQVNSFTGASALLFGGVVVVLLLKRIDSYCLSAARLALKELVGKMIGKTISHYRILGKLGEGGMGVVYEAEDTKLRRTVALKFLAGDTVWSQEAQARFLREARIVASLNHPSICTIHEVGETDPSSAASEEADFLPPGTPFIAMELIQGETLAEVISQSAPLRGEKLLDIALQVADGLATAHAEGIVHRDLKPQNVMVMANGRVKILDFGLAKPIGAGSSAGSPQDGVTETVLATRPQTIMGTVSYMSPEQARGQPVDPRSDVFSFGTMLYEMATGRQPFRGKTTTDTLAKILESEPEPPSAVTHTVLPGIEQIITRCLKKRPEDRYNDTRDLVLELRKLHLTEVSGGVRVTQTQARLRRVFLGLAVAMTLLVPAMILLWRWSNQPPRASPEIRATRIAVETFGCEVPPIAISPDGRFLAYTNKNELILAAIGSGEVKTLLQLEEVRYFWWVAWHPDGVHLLTEELGHQKCETWLSNIFTGKREPIHQMNELTHPTLPSISPDGQDLAYLWNKRREIRIRPISGGESSVIVRVGEQEELSPPVWSPDGTRLAYSVMDMSDVANIHHPLAGERHISLETSDLAGNRSVLIEDEWVNWSGTGVERPCWLPGGRLVYTRQTTMGISEFFVIDVDLVSGQPASEPRRFFGIDGPIDFDLPTASADGHRLAFVRTENHPRLILLERSSEGNGIAARQVSIDEWPTYPGVWSANGQRIFCSTERQPGDADIYVHDLDSRRSAPFVVTTRSEVPQCLTPDGNSLLYMQDRYLMSIPTTGGVSRRLIQVEGDQPILGVRCAKSPDSTCIIVLRDELELVVKPFQLTGELGDEVLRVEIDADQSTASGFDLSPDGSQIVITEANGRIRVFDLRSGESRQLPNESGEQPQFVYWSPTKKSIYLSGLYWRAPEMVNYWVGRLDLEGSFEILWGSNDMWASLPIPSPDGASVIFHGLRWETDIWMIEGF